jgi:hypothetical protein
MVVPAPASMLKPTHYYEHDLYIPLDMANDEVVNLDPMRDMVLNDAALIEKPQYEELLDKRTNKIKTTKVVATIKSKERFQFKWDALTKDIIIQNVSRSIKSTLRSKKKKY